MGCGYPGECRWVIMGCDTMIIYDCGGCLVGLSVSLCSHWVFLYSLGLSLIPWVVPLFGWSALSSVGVFSWACSLGLVGALLGVLWSLPWLCLYGALYALHWALFALLGAVLIGCV